jgi:hypothetical protein
MAKSPSHAKTARGSPSAAGKGSPKRVIVTFTVEPELLSRFDALAQREARTRSSQIVLSMRRLLEGEQP